MPGTFRRLAPIGLLGLASASACAPGEARGQAAVAFQPTVVPYNDGVTLPVVPVVSADRRYVRLSTSPQFTALGAVQVFPVPAAVGGGNFGFGAGGAGGGGGGGGRGALGMNGPGGGNLLAANGGNVAVVLQAGMDGPAAGGFATPRVGGGFASFSPSADSPYVPVGATSADDDAARGPRRSRMGRRRGVPPRASAAASRAATKTP